MQWRYAVTGRNYSRLIFTSHEGLWWSATNDAHALRIMPDSIRRYYYYYCYYYYNEGKLQSQKKGEISFHQRLNQKRKYHETPMASFSSSTISSSSPANDRTNVNGDTSTTNQGSPSTTLTSSSSSSSSLLTKNIDSPRLTLHMQRMQQNELRRQYNRQQRKKGSNHSAGNNSSSHNNNKSKSNNNNNNSSNNPTTITTTQQMQAQTQVESSVVGTTGNTTADKFDEPVPKFTTPEEVKSIMIELYQRLAQILQEVKAEDSEISGSSINDNASQLTVLREPLWAIARQQEHPPQDQYDDDDDDDYIRMREHHGDLFRRTVELQKTLYDYVDRQKIIRPGTLHRHEFVALVALILQIYSHLPATVALSDAESDTPLPTTTTTATPKRNTGTLFTQTLELIDWIRGPPYRFELSHKQCHAVITVAAKCQQWTSAAQIYMEHIDPEIAGYIPVPINTISARSFTMDGLFCIAHAAKLNKTLPVENVFDGVTKLRMVSPSDTESYVLSAGVALGHAGEWDTVRDYLKSSYKASQLGQPLVAATMHACVLCGRSQEAIDIFDDLVQGELASAAEWQWEGKKDMLHPACRDLAIRALGELKTTQNADEIKRRVMDLYNDAHQAEAQVSLEALSAVVGAWDDDLETVLNLVLSLIQKGFISRLVSGDDTQITSDQTFPSQTSPRFHSEWCSLLNLVMLICNSHQQYGLSLLCYRLFEVALLTSDKISDKQLQRIANVKEQRQYSDIVLTLLPVLCILNSSNEIVNTTMVALCGVKLPHEAVNLHNALASGYKYYTPRASHDMIEYAEFLCASLDSSSYQSWEPAHRHIHRLTASLAYIDDRQDTLAEAESILLSSALAVAIRECTVTSNPDAAILLGRWVESLPFIRRPIDAVVLFSESNEGMGLPVKLTDSVLSAAVEAFAQCGKARMAERLIQGNLGNDRPPLNWILSYHEAIKLLLSQGQNTDGLALFRTVIASAKHPALFCTLAKSMIASGNWRQVLDLYRQATSSGCASEELSLLTMESIVASGRIGQIDGQFPLLRSIISETSKSLGLLPVTWTETNYWKFKRVLGFSNARLIMGWDDYKLSRLDELDLAIETLEKRAISGLTPKNAVLFSVIQAAANLDQYAVPFNATGLPNVPRDTNSWIVLIGKALDEAKETRLFYEPNFIFEASMALRRVDRHVECLELVCDALLRGLKLNKATLENAVLSGQAVGMDDATTDIKMLLEGPM